MAEWVEYSTRANGDVFFFDNARVQKDGNLVNVWNRIRYKSSVMGASSYQSLMEIDCSEYSETTLQRTFYSDKNWTNPAMATDTNKKPKVSINANSATQRLANILCQQ
ncbi:surface-adhesin E family protein [uncultured Muriicola sp.]|uniref:surface-adhesin E family protein n=1 Tax=uncultured Muriicola sp. TaxID=1583102 RepID=UPI002610A720|nr:surface-adhesin E family protein [uncultured Muriicola sp.]